MSICSLRDIGEQALECGVPNQLLDTLNRVTFPQFQILCHHCPILTNLISMCCHYLANPLWANSQTPNLLEEWAAILDQQIQSCLCLQDHHYEQTTKFDYQVQSYWYVYNPLSHGNSCFTGSLAAKCGPRSWLLNLQVTISHINHQRMRPMLLKCKLCYNLNIEYCPESWPWQCFEKILHLNCHM